jgi:hypothetical protein
MGRDDGGNVNNVQYEFNQNCHYEPPLNNEHILIKNLYKKGSWFKAQCYKKQNKTNKTNRKKCSTSKKSIWV